jgi:hypothetical protein
MGMVSIRAVASELGVNKDYALRLAKKHASELGITLHRGKRNALSLSREDADCLISNYRPRFSAAAATIDVGRFTGFGFFYIIQLHPEDLPTRLKIGYADNLDQRLSDHRTNAPTLKHLKSWPCKRTWEEAAKASITREDCQRVGGHGSEVFDGDADGFIVRAEAFFALMPCRHVSRNGEPPGSALMLNGEPGK